MACIRTMTRILLIFQIIAFGLNSYADTICNDASLRHSFESSASSRLLEEFHLDPSSSSRLVMFGEIHYFTSTSLLVNLINKFNPQMRPKKCLFLEFSSAVKPQEMISKVEEAYASLPAGPSQERSDYTQTLNYFKPLVTAADKNGLQVFSVDHPENFGQGMPMNTRDEAMKAKITELLGPQGPCDDAIMFVGKAHITAEEPNRATLAKQLKQTSINVTTINVVEASDPVPKDFVSWTKLCTTPPFDNKGSTYIFSNEMFSPEAEMWPNHKGEGLLTGKWRDFDYTILAP